MRSLLAALVLLITSVGAGVITAAPAHAAPTPAFVQGNAWSTSARVSSQSVTLAAPVQGGDLLVGWFAEYNAPGQVTVSDPVNGAWTRAPGATAFQNDTGDIALYYVANAKANGSGLTVSVSASAAAYFQGSLAEYSGVAAAGPLDQIVSHRDVGAAIDTGATPSVAAGELVFAAEITGGGPGNVTPGSTQGVNYTARSRTGSGSAFEEDVTSAAAGPQNGRATLVNSTDWYAVVATFHASTVGDTTPPTVPQNLHATSVAARSVSLAWNASTDNVAVAGYTVYRNGIALGTTAPTTTSYIDAGVSPGTAYSYTVDAFDNAGNHSAPSLALPVLTPTSSPAFVQGISNSPGTRSTTTTLTLPQPVTAGHLLVGWFAQYDSAGQVQVSDNVNGAWTRSGISEHFSNGGGDIALYYVQNTRGASTLTVVAAASSPTYLPMAFGEYSGVAASNALDVGVAGQGSGTVVDSGSTATAPPGELVVGGLITGGQPLSVTPGSSQSVPFSLQVFNGSRSADLEGISSSAAGPQNARFTMGTSTDWYSMAATFRPGGTP